MILPIYRGWVTIVSLVVCLTTWFVIERTKIGAYLRAATENPGDGPGVRHQRAAHGHADVRASAWRSPAFAGVLAAPIYRVSPGDGRRH